MSQYLLDIPPEVRERIYYYCSSSDLVNLSCCSVSYYEALQYFIWKDVCISWEFLRDKLDQQVLVNAKFINSLCIFKRCNLNEPSEDTFDNFAVNAFCPIAWHDVADSYEAFITRIDREKLFQLTFIGVITDGALKSTLDTFCCSLQELTLDTTFYVSSHVWSHFQCLQGLKVFSLKDSRIQDSEIKFICLIQNLEELNLINCYKTTDKCFEFICQLTSLKKFSITSNSNISLNLPEQLPNLKGLSSLDLEDTYVSDDSLFHISRYLRNLTELNISWGTEISDVGLQRIATLPALKKLNIEYCLLLTDISFYHLTFLKYSLLHLTFSWNPLLSNTIFTYLLENAVKLKTLNIISASGMFSRSTIGEFCSASGMRKGKCKKVGGFSTATIQLLK